MNPRRVGVVGLGLLGRGITACFLGHGFEMVAFARDKIECLARMTGYVNADPDFTEAHLVINGASQLVRDVLGEDGRHARTALAMAQWPLGASVEVEMIFLLRN